MHPCIHLTFVSYDQKSSNSLNLVSLWFFDEFPNLYLKFFIIQTNQSLNHGLLSSKSDWENPWANNNDTKFYMKNLLRDQSYETTNVKKFLYDKQPICTRFYLT